MGMTTRILSSQCWEPRVWERKLSWLLRSGVVLDWLNAVFPWSLGTRLVITAWLGQWYHVMQLWQTSRGRELWSSFT